MQLVRESLLLLCNTWTPIKTGRAGGSNDGRESSWSLLSLTVPAFSREMYILKGDIKSTRTILLSFSNVLCIHTVSFVVENTQTVFMCPVKSCYKTGALIVLIVARCDN